MKKIFLSAFLIASGITGFAQDVKCPTISVSTSIDDVKERMPLTYSANVSDGPKDITYNWSISAGSITSGQGTSTITVDTDGLAGSFVTATVDVGGISRSCSSSASATEKHRRKRSLNSD